MEDWAEIRRLHRAEEMPIKVIARVMGCSKNTVKAALASEGPPRYVRVGSGSIVDEVEAQIRELLAAWPTMPATVIAERIGWEHGLTVLKDRVRVLRPVYAPALVAWVGSGATVAWFPLAPREIYVPAYPVSRRYLSAVNLSNTHVNTTLINNVYNTTVINRTTVNDVTYTNRRVPGAVMTTSSQDFASARPVRRDGAAREACGPGAGRAVPRGPRAPLVPVRARRA